MGAITQKEIENILYEVLEAKGNILIFQDGSNTFEANANNCELQDEQ